MPDDQGGFRLPPGVSYHKESLSDGFAFVFRHQDLGLLGRIVVQEVLGNSQISLELAGDPEDPVTAERADMFKPLGMELANRLEAGIGGVAGPQQGFTSSKA